MSWRAITDDDLRSAITAPEDISFRERLMVDGQSDPYRQIFAQVTGVFRDAIRSNPANELSPDPLHLPESAIFHAVALIRLRLTTRFSESSDEDPARADEVKGARQFLRDVAKPGAPTVSAPSDSNQTRQPTLSPAVNQSPRRSGWRNQDGI